MLSIRFAVEVAMLVALFVGGLHLPLPGTLRILAGLAFALVAAAIWGAWLAPKSKRRLRGAPMLVLEVALFAMATFALLYSGHSSLALAFAVIALCDSLALRAFGPV